MTDIILIKPCPFCGGLADYDIEPKTNGYFISCKKCLCSTPLIFSCGEPPGPLLLEKWNRRIDDTPFHHDKLVDDLAIFLIRLIREIRKFQLDHTVAQKALEYLNRHNFIFHYR